MRTRAPASRAKIQVKLSVFDIVLAIITPLVALYLRDAYILAANDRTLTGVYWAISVICSLIAFIIFRIDGGIPRYWSVYDLMDVAKAVLTGEFMTCAFLFTITRLEGIPRSAPIVHALLLGAGLTIIRCLSHMGDKKRTFAGWPPSAACEHVIVIGLNDLSVLYLKFLDMVAGGSQRVIALLDAEARWIGRYVNGVRVYGPPEDLESLVEEFARHGVYTDRVVISCGPETLSGEVLEQIQNVCTKRNLAFALLPSLFDHGYRERARNGGAASEHQWEPTWHSPAGLVLPRYFRFKRIFDVLAAVILVIAFAVLWMAVALLALMDVGFPIFFWQQRVGMYGRSFLLYKIRTLRASGDWTSELAREEERLSGIGRLLRSTRLDEFPQLLNVLFGDMSLVGPRPLLPCDQPNQPAVRLMVRPGITGWAQVHGGILLSSDEKKELDEFYIRNASLWLDLCIMFKSIRSLVRGDRQSDKTPGVRALGDRQSPRGRHTASLRAETLAASPGGRVGQSLPTLLSD